MRRKASSVFASILIACVAVGCANGKTTLEKAYLNYGRFVAAQEATVNFTNDPLVDQRAKVAAAQAVVAAKPFADTMYEAAREYAAIQQEIETMQESGQAVPEDKVLLAIQAEQKLRGLLDSSLPRILEAVKLVRQMRF